MMKIKFVPALAIMTSIAISIAAIAEDAARSVKKDLPGPKVSGEVKLPNGWALKPAGKQVPLGDFPVNIAVHPTGKYLAILHAGYGPHEIHIAEIDKSGATIISKVGIKQTFCGICFSPDGGKLYASAAEFASAHVYDFKDGYLSNRTEISVAPQKSNFVTTGLSLDTTGKKILAAGCWSHSISITPLDNPENRSMVDLKADSYPFALLAIPNKETALVSLWGASSIALIDTKDAKLLATWPTESHPTEMTLSPDNKTLFVACSNSTRVSILDISENGKSLGTLNCALHPNAPNGNTPGSLSLSKDGKILIVANADANNLSMFQVENPMKPVPMGFIPAGWYPTSVRFNHADGKIYFCNGKGLTSRPNSRDQIHSQTKTFQSGNTSRA